MTSQTVVNLDVRRAEAAIEYVRVVIEQSRVKYLNEFQLIDTHKKMFPVALFRLLAQRIEIDQSFLIEVLPAEGKRAAAVQVLRAAEKGLLLESPETKRMLKTQSNRTALQARNFSLANGIAAARGFGNFGWTRGANLMTDEVTGNESCCSIAYKAAHRNGSLHISEGTVQRDVFENYCGKYGGVKWLEKLAERHRKPIGETAA